MKKLIFFIIILFNSFLFCTELPEQLYGIWEGKDRIVFFEKDQNTSDMQIVIILKEYYGWYYDRAAEPESYDEKDKRTRNSATTRNAENVFIEDLKINKDKDKLLTATINLKYSNHQKCQIPFCILDDNIFLDYMESDSENPDFYRGVAVSKGFLLSEQVPPENISGFIIDDKKLYDVRYWKSDMEFSSENAQFKYHDDEYFVPKHILSAGNNYSCVSGRSKKIRNTVGPFDFDEEKYLFSEDKSVLIRQKEPYLTKIADKNTFEELMKIVKAANSRRKPDPAPLFPPSNLDWHWDIIDRLEANNQLIQAVRERQRKFGPRAKEFNK